MDIRDLLHYTQKNNASDLHLSTGNPPMLRIHGEMHAYDSPRLTAEDIKAMLHSIMTEQQQAEFERDLEMDFAISLAQDMRFRVNVFTTMNGPAAVLRIIANHVPTLEELGAPELLKKFAHLNKGLVLITGPTGSGKSTTLAGMINFINTTSARHVITIEDPVEYIHSSQKSLINQREVGRNTRSFAKALRSALREDPDVILVGELRDMETIQLALTAAETGHLVLATLHTNSAPKTIDRIIDVFPPTDKEMVRAMLAVSLEAVITQTLLKREGGGRIAAHEIMLGTSAVRNLIREGKIPQLYSLMQMSAKVGMRTMKECVMELFNQGIISEQTARGALASSVSDENDDTFKRPPDPVSKQQSKGSF